MKRPAFQQVAGDLVMRRPQIPDHCYPSFKPRPPIHQTSSRLHRGRQGRVSTLTGRVTTTSPLPPPFANLLPRLVLSREGLRPGQVTLRPGQWGKNAAHSARAPLMDGAAVRRSRLKDSH
jgi:hypothetical protein